jgi:hypothetical protein
MHGLPSAVSVGYLLLDSANREQIVCCAVVRSLHDSMAGRQLVLACPATGVLASIAILNHWLLH